MNRTKKALIVVIALALLIGVGGLLIRNGNITNAATLSGSNGKKTEAAKKPAQKAGIRKRQGRYYYIDSTGKKITGWKKVKNRTFYFLPKASGKAPKASAAVGWKNIDNHWYYFNKYGVMQTGWKEVNGKKYYLRKINNEGLRGAAVTGVRKIDKKWYIFGSSRGILKREMTKKDKEDFDTLKKAKEIVKSITNDKMNDAQKMRACFDWVMAKPYAVFRKFDVNKNWTVLYANDHFVTGGGDCHSDAAAYAYLLRALGYKNVYVCLDCDGTKAQGHSWAEFDGKVYDPLFAQARVFEDYYGVGYKRNGGKYTLSPVLKVQIAPDFD